MLLSDRLRQPAHSHRSFRINLASQDLTAYRERLSSAGLSWLMDNSQAFFISCELNLIDQHLLLSP